MVVLRGRRFLWREVLLYEMRVTLASKTNPMLAGCRGTSLIRNRLLVGPYRRTIPRAL